MLFSPLYSFGLLLISRLVLSPHGRCCQAVTKHITFLIGGKSVISDGQGSYHRRLGKKLQGTFVILTEKTEKKISVENALHTELLSLGLQISLLFF